MARLWGVARDSGPHRARRPEVSGAGARRLAGLQLAATLLAAPLAAQGGAAPGGLARHAMVGAAVEPLGGDSAGVRVVSVGPGYTAASVGLHAGDIVLAVDGRPVRSLIEYARAFRAWRAPGRAHLVVARNGARRELSGPIVPRPGESGEGIEVRYESVVSDSGDRVRTIVTRPAGVRGRLPAILFVGWLSCSSVELPEAAGLPGWRHLLHGLSRHGYLVLRVEKPGVGDSQGPDCSELGYGREVSAYEAALRALRARADADSARLVVFGASLGGATAPRVAAGAPVRGVVVFGTYARTWYEHLLGHERRRLELSGAAPAEVSRRVAMLTDLYARSLLGNETPGDVIRARPEYAVAWDGQPAHQYGRSMRYFREVQRTNIAAAWDSLAAPVLVLYGSNDWVMSREDHELIVRWVNDRRPGSARLAVLDGVDHDLLRYPDRVSSFKGERGGPAPDALETMVGWLGEHACRPGAAGRGTEGCR
jgi:alpha-beta hydrolase superfamily lysophospholipase